MIEQPTVLIVGAGASAPYGYPVGTRLVDLIIRGLVPGNRLHEALMKKSWEVGEEFHKQDLIHFRERLAESQITSIDEFLIDAAPEERRIGRAAIAHEILVQEDLEVLQSGSGVSPPDHWYQYLWNELKPGTTQENFSELNRLWIVSFNYDRSLDIYLRRCLARTFNIPDDVALSIVDTTFRIVHVHGVIGDGIYGSGGDTVAARTLMEASKRIRVLGEGGAAAQPLFEPARDLVGEAQRIRFLGFSYHEENVRGLGMTGLGPEKSVLGSAFGMGAREIEAASRIIPFSAKPSPKMRCTEFLRETVDAI